MVVMLQLCIVAKIHPFTIRYFFVTQLLRSRIRACCVYVVFDEIVISMKAYSRHGDFAIQTMHNALSSGKATLLLV